MRLVPLLLLLVSGCDVFDLSKQSDLLSGSWTTNVVPLSGECCHLELMLDSEEGQITGTGIVETPGQRVGASQEFSIEVYGTIIDDRVNLVLGSENNPGTIEGVLIQDYNPSFELVMQVNFEGFGHKGRNIVLFPRR